MPKKNYPFKFFQKSSLTPRERVITIVSKEYFLRFSYLFFSLGLSLLSCFVYQKEMLYIYLYPLYSLSQNVIFTSIEEAFTTTITICIIYSFLFCFPYFLYQSFCFFLPSFFPEERLFFIKTYISFSFSFIASYILCSCVIIPNLLIWFLNYGVSTDFMSLSLQAKVSSYLSWSQKIYVYSYLFLQIPLFFWYRSLFKRYQLYKMSKKNTSIFSSKKRILNRKYAAGGILLFCALISGPDPYSQGFLFFFFYTLFEYILWYKFLEKALEQSPKNI